MEVEGIYKVDGATQRVNPMVVRIATRIAANHGEADWTRWVADAISAIQEMRELTESMLDVAEEKHPSYSEYDLSYRCEAMNWYQAVIDEGLRAPK